MTLLNTFKMKTSNSENSNNSETSSESNQPEVIESVGYAPSFEDISEEEKKLDVIVSKQGPPQPVEEVDKDINGGYSWVILACTFTLSACSWGNNSGFAVYFAFYSTHNLYEGATAVDFAAIGGITFGLGISCAPIINYITGKITPKGSIIIGNICQFLALFITSFDSHQKLWQLYLTQGVLQSFGLAFLGLPSFTILPQWFANRGSKDHFRLKDRMLTFSQGVVAGGSGAGGILFNLGMQKVLQTHGIRWALRVQSFISLFLVTMAIIFLRQKKNKNAKIEFTIFDSHVFFFPGFWGLCLFFGLSMFGYVVTLYSLADWTISLGYSAYQGSIVAAMVSLGIIIGRPIVGVLADKYGAITISTVSYLASGILILAMWIPARNYATAIVLAILNGILSGAVFVCIASTAITVTGFRMNKFNVTFCMSSMCLGAFAIVSPIIGISLKKNIISPTQYVYCAVFVGASYFALFIVLAVLRGFMISIKEIETPGLTDVEYFRLRPKISRVIRNSLRIKTEYWI
ncbi:monocarboxylate transporter [Scheffersomyces amazonensis]|uniref:monocarboxylate transporter n=1 Tax=Scheffersomyces amazonensis TaxID=1078765 RepID=UPI00315D2BE5